MSSAPPFVQPFTYGSYMNTVLGFVMEPLVVISLLTASVVFNCRSLSTVSRAYPSLLSPAVTPTSIPATLPSTSSSHDTSPLFQQLDLHCPLWLPISPWGVPL